MLEWLHCSRRSTFQFRSTYIPTDIEERRKNEKGDVCTINEISVFSNDDRQRVKRSFGDCIFGFRQCVENNRGIA